MSGLTPDQYEWKQTSNGQVPHCGVLTQPKFGVGRVTINGEIVVGKIHQDNRLLYAPYDGKEYNFSNYDVLVEKTWACDL